jgi:hypothetical protein
VSWKAYVLHDDYVRDDTVLVIGRQRGDSTEIVTAIGHGTNFDSGVTTEQIEPHEEPGSRTLRMPIDMARALHEALSRHFGGVQDAQTLRKDYEAERQRVDRLIEHMANPTRAT